MHVAIVIVGFRNPGDVARCLDALGRASHDDFEVLVCENGGAAAYDALLATIPPSLPGGQRVTAFLASGNLGYAGAVNVCLSRSPDADAWWILNPDTQPRPQALSALVERLARGDCDAAGGVLLGPDGKVQLWGGRWRAWIARTVAIGIGQSLDEQVDAAAVERSQNFISGASMLVGRRFVGAIGPMREDYFLYCEEVEWCLRGIAKGMKLGFAPAAVVLHEHGTTTGAGGAFRSRPRLPIYLEERNKMLLTWDHFAAWMPTAAPAALAQLCLRYIPKGAWRQFGFGFGGWWAGLLGRRGVPVWIGD